MSHSVVIVGGGIAGQAVCEALRERDPEAGITLVCGETSAPYDRVRLSEILVSGEDPQTLQLRPSEWYADHDVDLLLGRWVTSVDVDARSVDLDDGRALSYDKLVLATGSQPLMPPISGIDLPGVHPFRGPEDCEAIRSAAAGGAKHAAVIGGGLLGLEAARGIAAQGCAVTVIHLLDRLMERQLDAGAAALLAPALAALDVKIQFERNTTAIIGPVRATGLHFKGGERLLADLVVVSVGIRPEVDARPHDGRRVRTRDRRRRRHAHEHPRRPRRRGVRAAPRHRLRARRPDPRPGARRGRHARRRRRRVPRLGAQREAQGRRHRPRLRRRGKRRARGGRHRRRRRHLPQARDPQRARRRGDPARRHARLRGARRRRALGRARRRPARDPRRGLARRPRRPPRHGADLRLQRRLQGRARRRRDRGRLRDAARGHGRHASRHRLRLVPRRRQGDRRRRDRRAVRRARRTSARAASRRASSSPDASATTA